MIPGATLQADTDAIVVNVPLKLKKHGGRKKVILSGMLSGNTPTRLAHQEALAIALARAYRWQKLLDQGKFESISNLAREIGLDPCFAARILRLTLIAPDIVEAVLMGQEPSGSSLSMLIRTTTTVWEAQKRELGIP
ncbi:MAG: hypothetical protein M1305_08120 [Candidatus Marsarchaeota archaeon]|nr:hypothetical protein [Candidatus Marsarchaeota archaeon]